MLRASIRRRLRTRLDASAVRVRETLRRFRLQRLRRSLPLDVRVQFGMIDRTSSPLWWIAPNATVACFARRDPPKGRTPKRPPIRLALPPTGLRSRGSAAPALVPAAGLLLPLPLLLPPTRARRRALAAPDPPGAAARTAAAAAGCCGGGCCPNPALSPALRPRQPVPAGCPLMSNSALTRC
jgi:hypothetical protein